MEQVNLTKTGIWQADGSLATSSSKIYTRATSSSALNSTYTLGFVEIGSTAQISKTSIEANQFYEI